MTTPPDGPLPPRNGAGRAALVLGLVAIIFLFIPILGDFVALPAAVGAVIAGFVGYDRIGRGIATNRGDAVVGGCLGLLALSITLVMFAAVHGPG